MFDLLIESRAGAKRRAGGAVVSLILHAMIVAGAVQATERVVRHATGRRTDTLTFVVAPASKAVDETASQVQEPLPAVPVDAAEMIPTGIPSVDIPSVDLSSRRVDVVAAAVGKPAVTSIAEIASAGRPAAGVAGVYESAQVDDPVTALIQPAPRYPEVLKQAGISGYVELEYVVDATGHAEPGSIRVLEATHAAFVEAAREAILAGVYRAATYRGAPVRQLVRQRIVFASS